MYGNKGMKKTTDMSSLHPERAKARYELHSVKAYSGMKQKRKIYLEVPVASVLHIHLCLNIIFTWCNPSSQTRP
jgi:hypothetical protein